MGFFTGIGSINIRRTELILLLMDGERAQAVLNSTEIIYLETPTDHSATSAGHALNVLVYRNGPTSPFIALLELQQSSEAYFFGTLTLVKTQDH